VLFESIDARKAMTTSGGDISRFINLGFVETPPFEFSSGLALLKY
jgi:hypothetical protein